MSKELEAIIIKIESDVLTYKEKEILKKALKRNEPVCVQTSYEDDDNHLFNCPNCDCLWFYSNEKNEWNFCPNCGQRLDWSVDDE